MTTTQNRELLSTIIEKNIKHSNYNRQNLIAKQFMDWTGLPYDDVYVDLNTDEDWADHYDILVNYFLPSMTDGEVEITLDEIHSHWFDEYRAKHYEDWDYDDLVYCMTTQW